MTLCSDHKGFLLAVVPASLGGALWEALGLPLGWLLGAAIVTGGFALSNVAIAVPKLLYSVSLVTLGASVGLAVTPEVAMTIARWAPVMIGAGLLGILGAAILSPLLSHFGRMAPSTAFFSLLPGGVVEMANVGEPFGADRTVVAALHALRVALVVGLLPLGLIFFVDGGGYTVTDTTVLKAAPFALAITAGLLGGWLGSRAGLPAAWLLGALLAVGLVSAAGLLEGRMPSWLLSIVQVVVGISLGARFQRDRVLSIPIALSAGLPILLLLMALMAGAAALASLLMPHHVATLILCFSIGGMAEMVLTAKTLGQNFALVAAFQAVRGILVNACAGFLWRRLSKFSNFSNSPKG